MKHTGEHQERNRNCSVISTESLFAPCSFTLCLGTGDGLKIIVHICRWARNRSLFPLTQLDFSFEPISTVGRNSTSPVQSPFLKEEEEGPGAGDAV
jgi:hypothetical protein